MEFLQWTKNNLRKILSACNDATSLSKIHAFMVVSGIISNKNSNGQLVSAYARILDIHCARKLFDKLPDRGIAAWNALIIAYLKRENPDEVLALYHQMNSEGIKPDSSSFTVSLKACASLLDLETGKEIQCWAVECGYENDVFVGSSLLNLYAKCGKMEMAMAVFDKMARRDLVSWTTIVTGYARSGRATEAIKVYRLMQKERIEGDGIVMLGLIQACASLGDAKMGRSIHGYMIRRRLPMDVIVQTSLVDMYAKAGLLDYASCVFEKMCHRTVVSWTTLISGCAQNGLAGKSLELLIEMQTLGLQPDLLSLVSALLACSQVGFLKLGKSIHGFIARRHGFDRISGTALIDMYSKCGSLPSAQTLFDRISSKDLICWNTIIDSYGVHGHGREALSLFLCMKEANLEPDDATFASLLSACSHSGLVEEGRYWFGLMVSEFKIRPTEKHYACMVDLLARAGQVEEARDLIDSMEVEPGLAIWVALLSGCLNYRKLCIGEMVARKILELNPDDPGIYTLVSNFMATEKMWDEVAEVRKMMKLTGAKKVPGYSVVEWNGKLHAFTMEDKSHPRYNKILGILINLAKEMRTTGYDPKDDSEADDLEE